MSRLRKPQTIGGVIYLAVVAAALVGLALVPWWSWRRGVIVIGVALLIGAVARAALDEHASGMLAVRSKWFDLAAMVGVGVVLIALAVGIPDQPGL